MLLYTSRHSLTKFFQQWVLHVGKDSSRHGPLPEFMGVQGGRLAINLGGRCPNSTSTRPAAGPCCLMLPRLCTASFSLLYVTWSTANNLWSGPAFQTLDRTQASAKKQHIVAAGKQAQMILVACPASFLKPAWQSILSVRSRSVRHDSCPSV